MSEAKDKFEKRMSLLMAANDRETAIKDSVYIDYVIELKNPLKLFTREHVPELSAGFKVTVNGADYAVKSASTNQLVKAYLLEKMP